MLKRLAALPLLCVLLAGCGGTSNHQSATGSVHPQGWGATPKGLALLAPPTTTVPTATMYDSIVVSTVPANPFAVAGYVSGSWPTYAGLRRTFSQAHAISIATWFGARGDCLDDEPGDATPAQAGPWVLADIRAGFPRPCVYSDLSQMPAVKASLAASLGANWRARVFLWLAWYRFVPGLVDGYDAVQYSDRCLGRNLDCSTVTFAFLSIAQPPYVAPKPKPRPSRGQVARWRSALRSSEHQYAVRDCALLSRRVSYFARKLKDRPRVRRAWRLGALRASRAAYSHRSCGVFRRRADFFAAKLAGR